MCLRGYMISIGLLFYVIWLVSLVVLLVRSYPAVSVDFLLVYIMLLFLGIAQFGNPVR